MTDNITKGEQIMISLLGRIAYPEEKLIDIITRKKRNPSAYIRGYNACDGKNIVSDIAKIIGVSQPTVTPILKDWENIGIIFEIDSPKGGKTYMRLYPLPNPKEKLVEEPNILNKNEPEPQTQISEVIGGQNGQWKISNGCHEKTRCYY